MSKTFKKCAIFAVTSLWLVVSRIIAGEINVSDNASDWIFTALVQLVGLLAIPLVLYKVMIKDESLVEGFALKSKINPVTYVVAAVIGIFLSLFIRSFSMLWQNVAFLLGFTPINSVGTIYSGPEVLVLSVLSVAVLPAFCEEFTYRGLGMSMLREVKNERLVILILGLLFGLGHQFILQTGYTFFAGLVFAYLAVRTKNIFCGVIVHFINNFLSVIGDYSEQTNGVYHAIVGPFENLVFKSYGSIVLTMIFSGAVVVALLFAVKKLAGDKKKEPEAPEETYYFPNTSQYVDDLFGKNFTGELRTSDNKKAYWYDYAFLYASVALTVVTTAFTFVWGLMR